LPLVPATEVWLGGRGPFLDTNVSHRERRARFVPWAAVRIEREVAQAHFTVDPDRLEIVIPQHDAGSLELRIFPARETATTALTRHLRPRVRF